MALVMCPECKKEISDRAESCPNCGYVMIKNELPKIRRSELSKVNKNMALGIMAIFMGIISVLGGIPLVSIILGIFIIIGGFAFIGVGVSLLQGTQAGYCPYCNNPIKVPVKAPTFKCNHCKKTSTRNNNFLETIE